MGNFCQSPIPNFKVWQASTAIKQHSKKQKVCFLHEVMGPEGCSKSYRLLNGMVELDMA